MFRDTLRRTRQGVFGRVASLLGATELTADTWDELEATLLQADLGVETALAVTEKLRQKVRDEGLTTQQQFQKVLKDILLEMLPASKPPDLDPARLLNIVMIVGVNGAGKTTSIAKLANRLQREQWRIVLAAADTFRAAAVDQLQTWGERINIPVIAGQQGGDPGAVTYDAIRAARARQYNLVIVDTAGRLHTRFNLMEELKKVFKVAAKSVHDAPHEVWLVVDGTTGQNALTQAKSFQEVVKVTGVIVTKLDSSARGGMVFAIGHDLGLPVRYIGVGEGIDDLVPFDGQEFVNSLFDN
jgi:fused signal recognition particle receptor